jgi:hypothetical protein
MKTKMQIIFTVLITLGLFGFKEKSPINECYFSFNSSKTLKADSPDRLPSKSEKFRRVKTDSGEVKITRMDGYRVHYKNNKKSAFVNLQVELSDSLAYGSDTLKLISHLKYLTARTPNMESNELITMEINGYVLYGLSKSGIETGSILGTFLLFPGDNTTVYFYFNNMRPEHRSYNTIEEYKQQRDEFLNEYTAYLNACKNPSNIKNDQGLLSIFKKD